MSPSIVTAEQILDAIQRVPVQRWGEVLQAIESLQSQPSTTPSPVRTGADLRGSDLIGIWADRTDMGNGHEFARRLRRDAEQRNVQGRGDAAGH